MNNLKFLQIRACGGCRRGETPGLQISEIRKLLQGEEKARFGTHGYPISEQINLIRDSLYTELSTTSGDTAHSSGYFELVNKSEDMICIKVLAYGGNVYHEINRPCYLAIPPLETFHGLFNPNITGMEVLILHDNPVGITGDLYYDTRAPGVNARTMISPAAQVENFNQLAIFYIPCQYKNVLVKYKGNGGIELKSGTKAKLVSVLGGLLKASGSSKNSSALNMDTNATDIVQVYPAGTKTGKG